MGRLSHVDEWMRFIQGCACRTPKYIFHVTKYFRVQKSLGDFIECLLQKLTQILKRMKVVNIGCRSDSSQSTRWYTLTPIASQMCELMHVVDLIYEWMVRSNILHRFSKWPR